MRRDKLVSLIKKLVYAKEVFGEMTYHGKGILLLLISTILLGSCSYWHTPALKYLIPEGYEGMIVISWDQKDGEPEIKDCNYELYKIPLDGFLKTQMKARNMSPEDEKYFSYDSVKGSRVELEMIDPGTYVDTVSITKSNQMYKLGWLSVSDNYGQYAVFFITRDKKSKFMDSAYREEYFKAHIDSIFSAHQTKQQQ